ncbi:ParB N-terminal domain-containing protein [Halalkalicoccus subterraneus]|uniref:hypothetical protein n=1 Tax=Halalkalicoccus subterraneus TaxID=2675002 RepID=UPI000EFA64BB|nr:hypothetical protein [Halalkalicoccus subterraneus]
MSEWLPARARDLSLRTREAYRVGGIRRLAWKTLEKALFGYRWLPSDLYWWLAPRYYRRSRSFETARYNAPLDPLKIEWVDPALITHNTMRPHPAWADRKAGLGSVRGGDWDRPDPDHPMPTLVSETDTYKMLEQRFVEGIPWEETDKIRRHLREIDRGEDTHSWSSRAEIARRCAAYERLYKTLHQDGYRSQESIQRDRGDREFLKSRTEEVVVDVGRDGQLLHVDGRHRLTLAQLLGIETIPVCVLVRHPEWMTARDAAFGRNTETDHPDCRE